MNEVLNSFRIRVDLGGSYFTTTYYEFYYYNIKSTNLASFLYWKYLYIMRFSFVLSEIDSISISMFFLRFLRHNDSTKCFTPTMITGAAQSGIYDIGHFFCTINNELVKEIAPAHCW
jgi:hypothetical protein